jgi:hypothetical protein
MKEILLLQLRMAEKIIPKKIDQKDQKIEDYETSRFISRHLEFSDSATARSRFSLGLRAYVR